MILKVMHTLETLNYFNPELKLKNIELTIENKFKNLLNELRRFKYVITLLLNFLKKETIHQDETTYSTFLEHRISNNYS